MHLLARAEDEASPQVRAQALTKAAHVFAQRLNDPEGALMAMRQAVKLAANHQRLATLEQLAFAVGQQSTLPAAFEDAAANAVDSNSAAAAWTAMSRWHRGGAAWEACATAAQNALACAPGDELALQELEEAQRHLQRWPELEQTLLSRIAVWAPAGQPPADPGKRAAVASVWAELAALYEERLANPKLALVACQKAVDIDPFRDSVWARMERLCDATGNVALGAQTLERQRQHAESAQQHTALSLRLATKWESLGKLEEACRVLQAARDRDPECVTIYNELAQVYGALGFWSQFVDNCWHHARITPAGAERARLAFEAGRVLQNRLGQSDAAQAAYAETLTHAPTHLNARRGLVGIYRSRGEMGALAESLWELADLTDDRDEKHSCWSEAAALLRDTLHDTARAQVLEARLQSLNNELNAQAPRAEANADAPPSAGIANATTPAQLAEAVRQCVATTALEGERVHNARLALVALKQAPSMETKRRFVPPQNKLAGWPTQVRHEGQSEAMSAVFALAAPAVAALNAQPADAFGFALGPTPKTPENLKRHPYVRRLQHIAATMGVTLPQMVASPRFDGFADLVVVQVDDTARWVLVLGQSFFTPHEDRIGACLLGQLVASLRPSHLVVWPAVAPSLSHLRAIVEVAQHLAGVRMAAHGVGVGVDVDFANGLLSQLPTLDAQAFALLRTAAATIRPDEDVSAWLRATRLTINRAGLVVCGDLAVALQLATAQPQPEMAANGFEIVRDLVAWGLSGAHAALRRQLVGPAIE